MTTTVTGKNQITIPAAIAARMNIVQGSRLFWKTGRKADRLVVHVLPGRAALARKLMGAGARHAKGRKAVEELVAARTQDDAARAAKL
jgi:AbrB family looped-hinge helix DNA binding protein